MKTLLAFLLMFIPLKPILAQDSANIPEEILLPYSPPQKVHRHYETNFTHHHDRGFYLSATIGPQWIHSIKQPSAKAIRFGSKLAAGWYIADGIALYAAGWGHFLEEASLIAGGPGLAFLFDSPNLGLDLSLGIGRAFNISKLNGAEDFAETVLAANLSLTKYWWLSGSTSFGASLSSGMHGLTLSQGSLSSFGWNVGLSLAFLFG